MTTIKTKAELENLIQKSADLTAKTSELVSQVKELEVEAQKSAQQAQANAIAAGSFRSQATYGQMTNSDEQRALRYFGCSHVKQLLDVNTGDDKYQHVPGELKQLVRTLKQDVDVARFTAQILCRDQGDVFNDNGAQLGRVKHMLTTRFGRDVLAPKLKAFGSTIAGGGDEWVPTIISSQYVQEFELEHSLDQKFKNINMPSNPFQLPVQKGVTKARGIAESATATSSNFGTTVINFTAQKLFEYYVLSEELTEDSAVDILPVARDEVTRAQVRARESGFLNGSKAGTHIDSDTNALPANVCEKLFNGLRAIAIANSANGGTKSFGASQLTEPLLRAMRSQGKKYFTNPKELMWICGTQVYQQFLTLPTTATVDKFGPMAPVLQGALAAYQGIPIYTAEYMREDLNASGVYDGTTTSYGGLILVNRSRFYVGNRRPIQVRVMQDLPYNDQNLLASYSRVDFEGHAQSATETSVVYGVDIGL